MSGMSLLRAEVADEPLVAEAPRLNQAHVLNVEQRRSQISGGHRLIRLVREKRLRLYTETEFLSRAAYCDAGYWIDSFLPALLTKVSENVTLRVNAAIGRARKNASAYDVKKVGIAEHIAEAFYDNHWYKVREENMPRKVLRDQIRNAIARDEPLELIFPIFSRKPFSPLKNRGTLPDLAEISSLAKCTEATQTVNALCPTGCRLTLLADGRKYNRACRTPDEVVTAYQSSLLAWKALIADDDIVRLVDYEQWLADNLRGETLAARSPLYARYCDQLTGTYLGLFDPENPQASLRAIEETGDVGRQLVFTFWSIATSMNYQRLFSLSRGPGPIPNYCDDEIQRIYVNFIASLHRPLHELSAPKEFFPSIGYFGPSDFCDLFAALRLDAFEAAIRYVSISLTDRDLNVLRKICPDAIKLTIHGKPGELHFLPASHRDCSITPQHSTGGIAMSSGSATVDLKYRLEREANNEVPVLVAAFPRSFSTRPGYEPMRRLYEAKQPILYVNDASVITDRTLHHGLLRRNS
jgi:hypothetical protein